MKSTLLVEILNGRKGEHSAGFEGVQEGNGYGVINQDGLRILDFCATTKLTVANTFFQKNISRYITYPSDGNQIQIGYILVKRSNLNKIKDTNVISSEECITQHKQLV